MTQIDALGIQLEGRRIEARTVLWAAGVAGSPLGRTFGSAVDAAGRVLVESDLSVSGHPEVFVAGDLASFTQNGQRGDAPRDACLERCPCVPRNRGASYVEPVGVLSARCSARVIEFD